MIIGFTDYYNKSGTLSYDELEKKSFTSDEFNCKYGNKGATAIAESLEEEYLDKNI